MMTDFSIPILDGAGLRALADDTLNWVDTDGRFCIGSRSNPDHVREWQEFKIRVADKEILQFQDRAHSPGRGT